MTENDIAKEIVDAAFKIRTTLGSGLFESVYATSRAQELANRGFHAARQHLLPGVWARVPVEAALRANLRTDPKVIIENRAGGQQCSGTPEAVAGLSLPGRYEAGFTDQF